MSNSPHVARRYPDGAQQVSYPPLWPMTFAAPRERYYGYPDCADCAGGGVIGRSIDAQGMVVRNPCNACTCRFDRSPLQVWHYKVLRRIVTAAETGFYRELDRERRYPSAAANDAAAGGGLSAAQRDAVREAIGARYDRMRVIVEVWALRRGVYGVAVHEPLSARAGAIAQSRTDQRVGLQQVVAPNGQRPARYPKLSGIDIMVLVERCLASARQG